MQSWPSVPEPGPTDVAATSSFVLRWYLPITRASAGVAVLAGATGLYFSHMDTVAWSGWMFSMNVCGLPGIQKAFWRTTSSYASIAFMVWWLYEIAQG